MAPRNGAADGRQRAARAVAVRRGELGMTQQQLADKAGVDVKTVGSLETRGRWPIARSRVSIERALGWQSGEMDRIASAPPDAREPDVARDNPRLFEALLSAYDGDREKALIALQAVLAQEAKASGRPGSA